MARFALWEIGHSTGPYSIPRTVPIAVSRVSPAQRTARMGGGDQPDALFVAVFRSLARNSQRPGPASGMKPALLAVTPWRKAANAAAPRRPIYTSNPHAGM